MDIVLFLVSLFMAVCVIVTAVASALFVAFMVMLLQEWLRKPKIRSLIMSDYITKESRLAV